MGVEGVVEGGNHVCAAVICTKPALRSVHWAGSEHEMVVQGVFVELAEALGERDGAVVLNAGEVALLGNRANVCAYPGAGDEAVRVKDAEVVAEKGNEATTGALDESKGEPGWSRSNIPSDSLHDKRQLLKAKDGGCDKKSSSSVGAEGSET